MEHECGRRGCVRVLAYRDRHGHVQLEHVSDDVDEMNGYGHWGRREHHDHGHTLEKEFRLPFEADFEGILTLRRQESEGVLLISPWLF